jgi:hypothetical protein
MDHVYGYEYNDGRHQAQIVEKGGSWQSAIVIALRSLRKSSRERKRLRKREHGGKARMIRLLRLIGHRSPNER